MVVGSSPVAVITSPAVICVFYVFMNDCFLISDMIDFLFEYPVYQFVPHKELVFTFYANSDHLGARF